MARVGAGEIFDGLSIVAHRGDNPIQSRGEMNLGAELDLAVGRAMDGLEQAKAFARADSLGRKAHHGS